MHNSFKFALLFTGYVIGLTQITWGQGFQFNILASLDNTNGANPNAAVVMIDQNNLLGTAYSGGSSNKGAIFRVTTGGTLTTLASFASTDGANPNSSLILGPDGNYYGTTYYGGTNNDGAVFKVSTNGMLQSLFSFNGSPLSTSGKNPNASLLLNGDGQLYGTAVHGGGYLNSGKGMLFKTTVDGDFIVLTNFNGTNGAFPTTSLTAGPDGLIYGTTSQGLDSTEKGTIFSIDTNGTLTKLFTFNGANGWTPNALVLGSDGNFYGTAFSGGDYGFGTLFRMSTNGVLSTLVSFNVTNGSSPSAALTFGDDGLLYGTTFSGGLYNKGIIFRMATNTSSVTVLHDFDGTNGASPNAALTLGLGGSFYGTTSQGGSYGYGTVFKLSPPAPQLNISLDSGMAILTWTNPAFGLQSAPKVVGVYTNLPGSMSPYTSSISSDQQFFRLIEN